MITSRDKLASSQLVGEIVFLSQFMLLLQELTETRISAAVVAHLVQLRFILSWRQLDTS